MAFSYARKIMNSLTRCRDPYPGIMSLKTANKDNNASLTIAWSSSLQN